jgi:hypothetical protein
VANNRMPVGMGSVKVTLGAKRAGMEEEASHMDRNKEMAGMGAGKFDVRAENVEREKRASVVEKEVVGKGPKKVGSGLKKAEKKANLKPKQKGASTKEKL